MSARNDDVDCEDEKQNDWDRFAKTAVIQTLLYPFEYSKVLMQIGYEPLAPRPGRTLFGKPALVLPNIFQYVKFIKNVDGFTGLWRGLSPKIVGNFFTIIYSEKVADSLKLERIEKIDKEELTDEQLFNNFKKRLQRDIVVHTASAIIYSPFHVISIRMMAQFVGRETKYNSLLGSITHIWKEEGIFGFFSGFIPRWLFDITCVVAASTATYVIGRHFIRERDGRVYLDSFSSFVCTSIFYPLTVVSTCMCINGTGLKAGSPPMMPIFSGGWKHCYNSLNLSGDHKRGSSLFFRYVRPNKAIAERI